MIKGFESITFELRDKELINIQYVVEILSNSIGSKKAKPNKKIASMIKRKTNDIIGSPRIRKMIHEIRVNNIVEGLISTSKGYYVAETEEEIKSYILSLEQRERSIKEVRNAMRRQILKYME